MPFQGCGREVCLAHTLAMNGKMGSEAVELGKETDHIWGDGKCGGYRGKGSYL